MGLKTIARSDNSVFIAPTGDQGEHKRVCRPFAMVSQNTSAGNGSKKTISRGEWQDLLDGVDIKTTYVCDGRGSSRNLIVSAHHGGHPRSFLSMTEPTQSHAKPRPPILVFRAGI